MFVFTVSVGRTWISYGEVTYNDPVRSSAIVGVALAAKAKSCELYDATANAFKSPGQMNPDVLIKDSQKWLFFRSNMVSKVFAEGRREENMSADSGYLSNDTI